MNVNLPTILIYHDKDSKTFIGDLPSKLRKTFGSNTFRLATSNRHNLASSIRTFDPSIIILPEITGQESFYSRHINPELRQQIKRFVSSGGMLVTNCASTYWMGAKILYHPPKQPTKIRSGTHVFNAASIKMFGPVPGYWLPSTGKADGHDCRVIDITVKTQDGLKRDKVWYGNGPCILPLGSKSLPNNLEPLAYYTHENNSLIAAAHLKIDKGSILMSGPLPHYSEGLVKSNNMLWRVISHRMHQQLFEKDIRPVLQRTP